MKPSNCYTVTLVGLRIGNQYEEQTLARVEAVLLEYGWILLAFIESGRKVKILRQVDYPVSIYYHTLFRWRYTCTSFRYYQHKLTRNAIVFMDSHSD